MYSNQGGEYTTKKDEQKIEDVEEVGEYEGQRIRISVQMKFYLFKTSLLSYSYFLNNSFDQQFRLDFKVEIYFCDEQRREIAQQ